jgi:protein-S-isoprenylcysteine O-methyltransferase Ste14
LAERVFVWAGGGVFVASLAFCAASYGLHWSVPDGDGWRAVAFNALLVSVFAAHHSVFAREGAKRWLARIVPERLQRSVYVWTASLLLFATCAAWRPIGRDVFQVGGARLWLLACVQLLGVWVSVLAVGGLDPLELAGIRQSSGDSRRSSDDQRLTTHGPYRLVRHPLYLGWILIVFGAAHMTGDRLAFAVLTTGYLLVAIPWEERSLVRSWGDQYLRYQRRVRWRVIPFIY